MPSCVCWGNIRFVPACCVIISAPRYFVQSRMRLPPLSRPLHRSWIPIFDYTGLHRTPFLYFQRFFTRTVVYIPIHPCVCAYIFDNGICWFSTWYFRPHFGALNPLIISPELCLVHRNFGYCLSLICLAHAIFCSSSCVRTWSIRHSPDHLFYYDEQSEIVWVFPLHSMFPP